MAESSITSSVAFNSQNPKLVSVPAIVLARIVSAAVKEVTGVSATSTPTKASSAVPMEDVIARVLVLLAALAQPILGGDPYPQSNSSTNFSNHSFSLLRRNQALFLALQP